MRGANYAFYRPCLRHLVRAQYSHYVMQRAAPMQVISLGLPRTGTMIMQQALQTLGYKTVWHCNGETLLARPHLSTLWNNLAITKFQRKQKISSEELEGVLGDFDACTDMPPPFLWKEMLDACPEARLILVKREIASWFRSFVAISVDQDATSAAHLLVNFAEPVLAVHHATMSITTSSATSMPRPAKSWSPMRRIFTSSTIAASAKPAHNEGGLCSSTN